jgi:hypothetical protein
MSSSKLQPNLVIQIDFLHFRAKVLSMKFFNSKHTLFDVVSQLCKRYLQKKLNEGLFEHLFKVSIHGKDYYGPIESPGPRFDQNAVRNILSCSTNSQSRSKICINLYMT